MIIFNGFLRNCHILFYLNAFPGNDLIFMSAKIIALPVTGWYRNIFLIHLVYRIQRYRNRIRRGRSCALDCDLHLDLLASRLTHHIGLSRCNRFYISLCVYLGNLRIPGAPLDRLRAFRRIGHYRLQFYAFSYLKGIGLLTVQLQGLRRLIHLDLTFRLHLGICFGLCGNYHGSSLFAFHGSVCRNHRYCLI